MSPEAQEGAPPLRSSLLGQPAGASATPTGADGAPVIKKQHLRLGIICMAVGTLFWLSLAALPFCPLPAATKLALSPVIIIAAELTFWLGSILAGKELIRKYRKQLNPRNWFAPRTKKAKAD